MTKVSKKKVKLKINILYIKLIDPVMLCYIVTRQNGGSGETDAQVRILIYHLLMDLRGVYKKTGIVDNPVPLLCFWSDLWILYHILCISILGGYGTDVYLAFSFHFFLIQIYYFVIS